MASVRICDRMGCSNHVGDDGWKVNKFHAKSWGVEISPARVLDLCDECAFEVFGVDD